MTRRAHPPAPAGRPRRPEGRTVLRLEALEDRCLLSSTPLPGLAPGSYDPSQILVQFRPAALPGGAPALNLPGATLGQAFDSVPGLYDVRLNGLSAADAIARLLADPRVLSAEPDYYVVASGTPNDPQFPSQWGLNNTGQNGGTPGVDVRAVSAWNVATGSPGVTVAMIDTGFDYDHADLYQNIWINQAEVPDVWFTKSSATSSTYDKIVHKTDIKTATPGVITFADLNNPLNKGLVWDNNGDGRIDAADLLRPLAQGGWDSGSTKDGDTAHPDDFFGWNFIANSNNPLDDNGHGTNTAGILGATGNNGVGVAGLDWRVQLQGLKVFNNAGIGTVGGIVAAIDYSIQHGAKIESDSWALAGPDSTLFAALQQAQTAGQAVVVAAGNGGASSASYPAAYSAQLDNVVSVAAVTNTGALWSGSNFGATTVTLGAPGVGILGTALGGGYSIFTGTSQAVPFVSGTLALVWGQHPTWTYRQVVSQITSHTTPLSSLKGKTVTGGLVNTAAALDFTTPAPTPHVIGATFTGPDAHSLSRVALTFDQAMDPTSWTASQVRLFNPFGQAIPLTAVIPTAGSGNKQMELDFAVQTAPGQYTLVVSSGVRSAAGAALAPYSTNYELIPAFYTFTNATKTAVPDPGTASSAVAVGQDIAIGSVQVTLNISHPFDGDLYITLQAPDGTTVVLVNRRGGSGQDFVGTVLSDAATTSIGAGRAPFTGTFRPETPLSVLIGKNARGVWRLYVADVSPGDAGIINSFALTIAPASGGPGSVAGRPSAAAAVVAGVPSSDGAGPVMAPAGALVAPPAPPQAGQAGGGNASAADVIFSVLGVGYHVRVDGDSSDDLGR